MLSLNVYQQEVPLGKRGKVVAASDGRIVVWSLPALGPLTEVFSYSLNGFLPKAVHFCPNTRDVFVFARTGGEMYACVYS